MYPSNTTSPKRCCDSKWSVLRTSRLLSDSDPAVGHLAKTIRPGFKELNRKELRKSDVR